VATRPTVIDRYDITKFTDEVFCKRFKSEIHKRSRELNIDSIGLINNTWRRVQETIKETSSEVLGKPKNTKKPWFNERYEKNPKSKEKKLETCTLMTLTKYNESRKEAS